MLIPLVIFVLIIIPIEQYLFYINFWGYEQITFFNYYLDIYLGFGEKPIGWTGPSWPDIQMAHLWFIEHLLFYGAFYSL